MTKQTKVSFGERNLRYLLWKTKREDTSLSEIVRGLVTTARENDGAYLGDQGMVDDEGNETD